MEEREKKKTPWWLWPNMLSLDAPIVAVTWLFIISLGWRNIYVPWELIQSLACAVWIVYVLDRIIDARNAARYNQTLHLDRRHEFHYKHRGWFLLAVIVVAIFLLQRLLYHVPKQVFWGGMVPLALTVGYVIFAARRFRGEDGEGKIPYLKNTLAGFAFATGTAVSAAAYQPINVVIDLFFSSEVLCFSLLCVLNITAIDIWAESPVDDGSEEDAAAEVSLTMPLCLLALFTLFQSVTTEGMEQKLFSALFVSSACFYALNRYRHRFSIDLQRVLADVALLVPVPIFYF